MSNAHQELLQAAWDARRRAICPFSNFPVGATIRAVGGRYWTGANIETATLNLGLCAERVALFNALSQGARAFDLIVIVSEAAPPVPPCGPCRQLLWEFAADARVLTVNRDEHAEFTVEALLPLPFDAGTFDPSLSG